MTDVPASAAICPILFITTDSLCMFASGNIAKSATSFLQMLVTIWKRAQAWNAPNERHYQVQIMVGYRCSRVTTTGTVVFQCVTTSAQLSTFYKIEITLSI